MFAELGWVDSDWNPQEGNITADIATLPVEMSEALMGDEFEQCVEEIEEMEFGYSKYLTKNHEIQNVAKFLFSGVFQSTPLRKLMI